MRERRQNSICVYRRRLCNAAASKSSELAEASQAIPLAHPDQQFLDEHYRAVSATLPATAFATKFSTGSSSWNRRSWTPLTIITQSQSH
jgi:hypothetical protein